MKSFATRFTVAPGNSQYVVPWDTTRGIEGFLSTAQASNPAPGGKRGAFAGKLLRYTIRCTGQNCTVDEQILSGNAGTNADWETQETTGNYTLTASTTAVREFKWLNGDARVLVTAGATGPTTFFFYGTVVDAPDHGS